jgi:hypothetical protein
MYSQHNNEKNKLIKIKKKSITVSQWPVPLQHANITGFQTVIKII